MTGTDPFVNPLGVAPMLAAVVGGLILYLYFSWCTVLLAKKTGETERAWWGWIPVIQVFLLLRVAGLSGWWILALFIPVVNLVVGIWVWIRVAIRRSKPAWTGLLMVVPVLNLFFIGYLAFSD